MIRFLVLCFIFFALYIAFSVMSEFDSNIKLLAYGYEVDMTLFTFGMLFAAAQLVLFIILKSIFLILNLPSILKNRWMQRKLVKTNQKLLYVLAELLMGKKDKSLAMINKIINEVNSNNANGNKEVANLVFAEAERKFDKKIRYLQSLIGKKHYSFYANKNLAMIFHENGHYKQAEEYALQAFNENDTDPELMLSLLRIYAALNEWPKMVFIFSKLQRVNVGNIEKNAEEIARYYYTAAKFYLRDDADDEALKYLEYALEINPAYIEALNLFTELSNNNKNNAAILKVLKAAFSFNPCFEIARMYADNVLSSPEGESEGGAEAIYGSLSEIVQPSKYPALFLALAAYLGLIEKIQEIKERN